MAKRCRECGREESTEANALVWKATLRSLATVLAMLVGVAGCTTKTTMTAQWVD